MCLHSTRLRTADLLFAKSQRVRLLLCAFFSACADWGNLEEHFFLVLLLLLPLLLLRFNAMPLLSRNGKCLCMSWYVYASREVLLEALAVRADYSSHFLICVHVVLLSPATLVSLFV